MSGDQYTVVLRGETFTLYRDQIEFDSPNYFTALFLGDFRESRTQRVALSRSPDLFRVIVEYMSGYTVLPLAPAMVPSTMTPETALANLLNDAEYYQLSGLVRLIRPAPCALLVPPEAYRAFNVAPRATLKFEDVLSAAKLDVVFDSANGIGRRADDDWQPVLISIEGIKLKYEDQVLRPMLTVAQQGKLTSRGIFQPIARYSPWTGPVPCDGTLYVMPPTEYTPYATTRLNGSEFPAQRLLRICAFVSSGGGAAAFDVPTEKSAFLSLSAAYNAENRNIFVWCRKLIFTISRSSGSLYFCIVHADCVTRDRLISQLGS
ncbi:hypothetical protein EXIGLDRAFT_290379 [Exidia glandulosa HHB12029]|uniref:BTB domain-containing protein n=1 Tax=Exidia glandulosa HHB12029 TaxID=1314781 RepID=A0A165DF47_EXIGL|nr:hypothetical protein EXIGLDRAFT_290379 [Exidia glandulosa HHB12029]